MFAVEVRLEVRLEVQFEVQLVLGEYQVYHNYKLDFGQLQQYNKNWQNLQNLSVIVCVRERYFMYLSL